MKSFIVVQGGIKRLNLLLDTTYNAFQNPINIIIFYLGFKK
jgi:hypothetical protein